MRTTQILLLLSVAADLGTVLGSDHNEILAKERSALKVSCPSSSLKRIGGLQRGAALTHAGLVLLAQRKIEHAAACVTQAIDTANEPQAWTVLGEIVRSRGQDAAVPPADALFQKAASLSSGVSVSPIRVYELLGPFSIGKGEVDGDPLEAPALGGIGALPLGKGSYHSEYAGGGQVSWQAVPAQPGGLIDVSFPKVKWNELVQTTNSMPILEWQAWAVAHVIVHVGGDYKISCQGVHTFSIGRVGQPWLSGDIYRTGMMGASMRLAPGVHKLYARVRAKVQTQLQCEAAPVSERLVVYQQQFVPDVVNGALAGQGLVAIPVRNMNPTEWISDIKASVEQGGKSALRVRESQQGLNLAPGQLLAMHVWLEVEQGVVSKCPTPVKVKVSGMLTSGKTQSQTVSVRVRCRDGNNQSFLMAFLDHDGSANQAAVIPPLTGCRRTSATSSTSTCPVLLSMHGTGVPANDQADAYKVQLKDGSWQFGVRGAWTLAPSRHGAHNWEGTGMRSALAALAALSNWTTGGGGWGGYAPADPNRVLFAGHSMGGHGAWVISTHFPDFAVGVASAAGWIRKEYYGDSNDLFLHDLSVAHADAQLKAIFESTVMDNYVDLLAGNLRGVPVWARVGSEDRSVPPWQQRRMSRVLSEHNVAVSYEEIQGQAHWWWDSKTSSDGGCVNDEAMRAFFAQQLQPFAAADSSQEKPLEAAVPTPAEFEVVVVNPGSFGSKGGLKILQQHHSYRQSRISVRMMDRLRILTTRNVRRFALVEVLGSARVRGLISDEGISVDGTLFSPDDVVRLYEGYPSTGLHVCRDKGIVWAICDENFYWQEKSPLAYGPARQVFEAPFLFVTPNLGEACATSEGCEDICKRNLSSRLLQSSVYLANMHRAAASTHAQIKFDTDLTADLAKRHNLVLMGTPEENQWVKRLLERLTVKFGPLEANATAGHGLIPAGHFAIGGCVYGGPGVGLVYTFPMLLEQQEAGLETESHWNLSSLHTVQKGGAIGLGILGTDEDGLRDAVSLGAPTIPPMVRAPFTNMVPDYIVTSSAFRWKGIGGIVAAGFWGHDWKYSSHTSYIEDVCQQM